MNICNDQCEHVHLFSIICWHFFMVTYWAYVCVPVASPTFNNITNNPALISRGIKLLMNQLSQRVPLFSPMILIVSLRRASFSYTTPLMMIATEYIHAKVMKRGIDRLITRRNLKKHIECYTHILCRTETHSCFNHSIHLHIINVAGVGHLLNVDSCLLLGAGDSSDNSLFDYILQVGKPTPDIPQVLKGVCPGTRVPISAKQDENQEGQRKRENK